jgi:hypothetical protein
LKQPVAGLSDGDVEPAALWIEGDGPSTAVQDGAEEQQGEPGCRPTVEGAGESGESLARYGERMRGCHGWLRPG